ncbi:MAG: hypothetical protein LBL27_01995, partial [Coriobacteriales bacterium]|nr:hypothetical protein [Coriobacteriales bacterium]
KPHLFVNDYQNLGRASQLLCHLLATDSLTIAADPVNSVEVFERFPYAAGVEEFVRVNQSATTQTLAQKQAAPHIVPMAWDNPDDEFSGIAEVASERIAAGTPPEHIAVVCFHRLWFERIVSELKTRKLPVRGLYQPLALQGDIRSLERSLPLRIVTALRLLVNPNDSMSWRCWIGFGDYLANSANFVEAKDAAEVKNPEAVFADSVSQWEGYRQSLSFLESCRNQRGLKLLEYLTQSLSASQETTLPSVLNPLLKLGETATPAEMLAVLKREQFFAQFSSPDGVTVTSLEALVGLKFKTVIAAGFVNGFFPSREYFDLTAITINQQKKMEATDKQRLNLLVSAGSNELILSHFKTIEAETADHLNLKSTRIFLTETGTRTSQISLSVHAPS